MEIVHLVAALAIMQFIFFGYLTGKARVHSGLKAPAMVGDDGFERMYRVQINTLEILVAFLPALFIAGVYWSGLLIMALGLTYIVGRFIYWKAYVSQPSTRTTGFMLSLAPTLALLILAILGPLLSLVGFF